MAVKDDDDVDDDGDADNDSAGFVDDVSTGGDDSDDVDVDDVTFPAARPLRPPSSP